MTVLVVKRYNCSFQLHRCNTLRRNFVSPTAGSTATKFTSTLINTKATPVFCVHSCSTCDTPRELKATTFQRGTLHVLVPKALEKKTFACYVRLAAGRFSRSRLRGTQGGRVYTIVGERLGPCRAPWRAFMSGESRSIWKVITESLSDPPSQARPWKPPKSMYDFFFALLLYLLQVSHQPSKGVYFDAATVQKQQRFKFSPLLQSSTVLLRVC